MMYFRTQREAQKHLMQRHAWRGMATSIALHVLVVLLMIIFVAEKTPLESERVVSVRIIPLGGAEGSNGSPPNGEGSQSFDIFAVTIIQPQQPSVKTRTVAVTKSTSKAKITVPQRRWATPVTKRSYASVEKYEFAPPDNRVNDKLAANENYSLTVTDHVNVDKLGDKERTGSFGTGSEGDGTGGYPGGNGLGSGTDQGIGGPGSNGTGPGGYPGFRIDWGGGMTRKLMRYNLPKYPEGVNITAQIKLQAIVQPDGSIKNLRPMQKANTALENVAIAEARLWKFESLNRTQPQQEQTCVITFNFELR